MRKHIKHRADLELMAGAILLSIPACALILQYLSK